MTGVVAQQATRKLVAPMQPERLPQIIGLFVQVNATLALDVDDAPSAAAIDLLDPEAYFTGKPRLSKRH